GRPVECPGRVAGGAVRRVLLRRLPVPPLSALSLPGRILRAPRLGRDPGPDVLPADRPARGRLPGPALARRLHARARGDGAGDPAVLLPRPPARSACSPRLRPLA